MLKLIAECARCGKVVELDIEGRNLSNDILKIMRMTYLNINKENLLICGDCHNLYLEFKDKLVSDALKRECEFFNNCDDRNKRKR